MIEVVEVFTDLEPGAPLVGLQDQDVIVFATWSSFAFFGTFALNGVWSQYLVGQNDALGALRVLAGGDATAFYGSNDEATGVAIQLRNVSRMCGNVSSTSMTEDGTFSTAGYITTDGRAFATYLMQYPTDEADADGFTAELPIIGTAYGAADPGEHPAYGVAMAGGWVDGPPAPAIAYHAPGATSDYAYGRTLAFSYDELDTLTTATNNPAPVGSGRYPLR